MLFPIVYIYTVYIVYIFKYTVYIFKKIKLVIKYNVYVPSLSFVTFFPILLLFLKEVGV